ncbi:hypothetical protein I4U23_031366 [Adineta vaga]|nr:hypothetical protein I4U23_031366 [Adineta vaga]
MNIDANGVVHVDAEEARSGAKVSYTIDSDHQNFIKQHIVYVESQANAVTKSVSLFCLLHVLNIRIWNGSFLLNKELGDVFHLDHTIFHNLEYYLNEHDFKLRALNLQNEILHLIGTGVILLWLVLQISGAIPLSFKMASDPDKSYDAATITIDDDPAVLVSPTTVEDSNTKDKAWINLLGTSRLCASYAVVS